MHVYTPSLFERDGHHADLFERLVVLVRLDILDRVDDLEAAGRASKHTVLSVFFVYSAIV